MKESKITEEQSKTIEVLLNKKKPKSRSSEKRKLFLITSGVLVAIAAPVTVAAVMVTKAHTDKNAATNERNAFRDAYVTELNKLQTRKEQINIAIGEIERSRNALKNLNDRLLLDLKDVLALPDTDPNKVVAKDKLDKNMSDIVDSITSLGFLWTSLTNEKADIETRLKEIRHLLLASASASQVVETIYSL